VVKRGEMGGQIVRLLYRELVQILIRTFSIVYSKERERERARDTMGTSFIYTDIPLYGNSI